MTETILLYSTITTVNPTTHDLFNPTLKANPPQSINKMGAQDVLSRKAGVIVGDDVLALFKYAREHEFAIPAINVTSSSTVVAALEGARDAKSPIILYVSYPSAPSENPPARVG